MSALTANEIATAVTGGQGVSDAGQLAIITAATTLLGGGIAAASGQNTAGAVNAAANETLNNACSHDCGDKAGHLPSGEKDTVSILPNGGASDTGGAGAQAGAAPEAQTVGAGPLLAGTAGAATNTSATPARSGVDFYVNAQGIALPATGYRYMGSQYAEVTQSAMTAPLSYFGFTDYSTASEALNGYQIDPIQFNNDATLKGVFDTLQLFGRNGFVNAQVPLANGGVGPGLEPYTSSYPQLGSGGQAQLVPVIPGTTVNLNNVTVIPKK